MPRPTLAVSPALTPSSSTRPLGPPARRSPPTPSPCPPPPARGTSATLSPVRPAASSLSGNTLTGDPATITAQAATPYTYTATDAGDGQTASLTFTIAVVSERAILQTLYNETGGANWTDQSGGWANPIMAPCLDDLHGVTVDTSGRVLYIRLFTNNLAGEIPDLSALTGLTRLYLQDNQLTGRIPTIPDPNDNTKQVIALPPSLIGLWLNDNHLSGEIPDLSALTSLTNLVFRNNQLTGRIPTTLPPSLSSLSLSNNRLHGPLPDLRSLTRLTTLDLSTNQLGLDANGQKIVTPDLDDHIPPSVSFLRLSSNKLSGPLPDLSALNSLEYLYMHTNELRGPLPDLSALTNLRDLRLYNNDLTGSIPTPLPLTLTTLELYNNQLNGPIPPQIGDLPSLQYLTLSGNQLTGPIPTEIGDLTGLLFLYLHNNQLSGEIPTQIGDLTGLARLTLHNNAGLYNYPSGLADKSSLLLRAPGDGTAVCLPTTMGGTDCTIPTQVDQLHLRPRPPHIRATWQPHPAGSTPGGYELAYRLSGASTWTSVSLPDPTATTATTATIRDLTPGRTYDVRVRTTDSPDPNDHTARTPWLWARVSLPPLSDYPATVSLAASTRRPAEGATVQLTATLRTPAPAGGVTVQFSAYPTGDHPAYYGPRVDSGDDYVLSLAGRDIGGGTTPEIEIPEGKRQATATLRVWDDAEPEGHETFGVTVNVSWTLTDYPELVFTIPANDGGSNGGGNGGGGGSGGGSGSGGGGGGTRTPDDQHGDTLAEATRLNPRGYATGSISRTIAARLQSRTDIDYFTLALPSAGVLLARTTGGDTTGRLYQVQDDGTPILLAEATARGPFEVGVAVDPGTYYLAVSAGASFGDYRLLVDYTPAFVENPAPNAPQSGLGVLSGLGVRRGHRRDRTGPGKRRDPDDGSSHRDGPGRHGRGVWRGHHRHRLRPAVQLEPARRRRLTPCGSLSTPWCLPSGPSPSPPSVLTPSRSTAGGCGPPRNSPTSRPRVRRPSCAGRKPCRTSSSPAGRAATAAHT